MFLCVPVHSDVSTLLVYASDSQKRNFDSFIFQVHVKKLTKTFN